MAVADYSVPSKFRVEDLVARLCERTGERCEFSKLERPDLPDNYCVYSSVIGSSVDLWIENGALHSERMMPLNPYFDLQLELAVVDLGGQPLGFLDRAPRDVRADHPDAALCWRELPWKVRWATGRAGRFGIGVLSLLVNIVLLETCPLQLLFAPWIRRWQERRRAQGRS